jgi:hypothetical protein
MARVANPWEASTGAHAAAAARPPLEPPKQTTPGNGPSPAGRANSPHTPGSRTGVAAASRVSQCRSRTASAIRPAVAAWTRAVSGADGGRRDGPTGWPDHHSPNGSTPV